jgi:N-acetylglutamate synthase-like GNAT family acetyltransferase
MPIIRQARANDFESIFILIQELWDKHKFNKKKTKLLFLQQIKIKGAIQLVIEEENRIIAYGSAYPELDIKAADKIIKISELIIKKEYRRRGYGKKIFKDIINRAKKKGYKEFYLISSFKRL